MTGLDINRGDKTLNERQRWTGGYKNAIETIKDKYCQTSLVVQWIRIHLSMQGA